MRSVRRDPKPCVGDVICYYVRMISESFNDVHMGLVVDEEYDSYLAVNTYKILWSTGNISYVRHNLENVILKVVA